MNILPLISLLAITIALSVVGIRKHPAFVHLLSKADII